MKNQPIVVATRAFPEAVHQRLAALFDARLNLDDTPYSTAELAARAAGAAGVMIAATEPMDRSRIEALPDTVRIIATFSVGYEHIDLAAAKERGIVVTNTPDVVAEATAEIALLLLLGAARRAHEGATLLRTGGWTGWTPTQLLGTQLTGKRLGIVGMGAIGRAFARRARACGLEIHYNNRNRLKPELEDGAVFHASVEEMLPRVQFLSLHCPLTPQTRRLLDARRLALLPEGAIVINTARGGVVDDDALIDALRTGRLAGIGLDVFEGEPRIDPRYAGLERAFLLPHLGTATVETRNAMGFRAIDNLVACLVEGRDPPDRLA